MAEIPLILKREVPPNPSSTLGTGNVTDRPVAIALGRGHNEAFEETRDAVEKACGPGSSGLLWLKNDTTKPGPDVLGPEYSQSVADRLKNKLKEVEARSKGV